MVSIDGNFWTEKNFYKEKVAQCSEICLKFFFIYVCVCTKTKLIIFVLLTPEDKYFIKIRVKK